MRVYTGQLSGATQCSNCLSKYPQFAGQKRSSQPEKRVCWPVYAISLRPFRQEDDRKFETFEGISHDPTYGLDRAKLKNWMDKHKNNIMQHYPETEESTDLTD